MKFVNLNTTALLISGLMMSPLAQAGMSYLDADTGEDREISLEEMKDRCINSGKYTNQQAPQNIRVQCHDRQVYWLPATPGEMELDSFREVTSAVFANKYVTPVDQRSLPASSKKGTCYRFKEMELTLALERSLSCEQLTGMKTDLTSFCADVLDSVKGTNSKQVAVVETGNIIDTCGGGGIDLGKDGKGDKNGKN